MGAPPDAPWKKTWPLKAFQRMVRYAAENGYDSISWTPGEVQADRYDLSKHIDRLVYYPKSGQLYASKGKEKLLSQKVKRSNLADVVGKEAAEKLLNTEQGWYDEKTPYHQLEGQDLKIGGKGMKGFYDKILPAEVNKFFNKAKWGNAKVGTTTLPSPDIMKSGSYDAEGKLLPGKEVWTLPITPEMKSKALGEGFWSSQIEKKQPMIA